MDAYRCWLSIAVVLLVVGTGIAQEPPLLGGTAPAPVQQPGVVPSAPQVHGAPAMPVPHGSYAEPAWHDAAAHGKKGGFVVFSEDCSHKIREWLTYCPHRHHCQCSCSPPDPPLFTFFLDHKCDGVDRLPTPPDCPCSHGGCKGPFQAIFHRWR